ncbi:hypothetical protein [Mesorhizobium sp. M0208]|uniref:hypothetical protein n=1 Tax=Mesorhizobium sp. M0208 TaxID=2956916 RepID=UPI00333A9A6E
MHENIGRAFQLVAHEAVQSRQVAIAPVTERSTELLRQGGTLCLTDEKPASLLLADSGKPILKSLL